MSTNANERWAVGPGESRTIRSGQPATGGEAAQIEAEIARKRREMSGTVDELQRRLDPERIKAQVREQAEDLAEQAKQSVRDATIGRAEHMVQEVKYNARSMRAGVIDTVRENPIPAALAAIGIGWLFMNGSSRGEEANGYRYGYRAHGPEGYRWREGYRYSGYQAGRYRPEDSSRGWTEGVGETAGRFQERAGEMAGRVQDQAGSVVGSVQEQASRTADQVQQQASRLVGDVQERAGEFVDQAGNVVSQAQFEAMRTRYRVEGMMRSNPLAAGAVALAAGVVVGMALPETEPEHRLMGEARDTLMERAGEVAKDAVGQVSQAVTSAADAAQEAVAGVQPEDTVDRLEHAAEQAAKAANRETRREGLAS
jgi:hypothetical protein